MKHKLLAIILMLGMAFAPYSLADEISPEIANCEEVQDEATLTQMEFCSAHIGCNMVLKIHKACAKAKNFLNKLKTTLSGKKEISNESLFEAGLPELTISQAMGSKIVAAKRALQESRAGQVSEVKIWKNSSGEITHYYEGGVKNNEMDGTGVLISVQGVRVHGQMKNGRIEGQARLVTRDGDVFVGDYVNNLPNGNVAFQAQNGAVLVGNYSNGKWRGVVDTTTRDGTRFKQLFDSDGNSIGSYPVSIPDSVFQQMIAEKDKQRLEQAKAEQAVARITKSYDQRIDAAREQCSSSKDSCDTGCTAGAAVSLLSVWAGKGAGANEAGVQIQQCSDRCKEAKNSCDQQVSALKQEKSQAIAAANTPKQPPQTASVGSTKSGASSGGISAGGSTGSSTSTGSCKGGYSSQICDGQCALIVESAKCKHVRDPRENLRCMGNILAADTPELCAEARCLSGCVMKADYVRPKLEMTKSTHNSVCERNFKKIEIIIFNNNIAQTGATYDLFMKDINWYTAKVFEPCISLSAKSARSYKSAMDEYNKISQYCAGPHQEYECTQWGPSGGISVNGDNIQYYKNWKAEVDKALSDPNYSAELGPIKGSSEDDPAEVACANSLKAIEKQYDTASGNIPPKSVVVLSEAKMWKIAESIAKIKAQCPQSGRYATEVQSLQTAYKEIKRACDASSSNPPCTPRLPGKAPVSAPQVVAIPLPPLKDKPKGDCGKPPSASAIKCLEEKCAPDMLRPGADGCYFCSTRDTGRFWSACPDGRNVAQ